MYRIVLLVLCYQALSQPVTNEASPRHSRDLIECCPCPVGGGGARDGPDRLVGADDAQRGRVRADDCPCRGTDSEGATSLFFPSALRADGSHLKASDPKEDSKNLLQPEVVLATSVLDTLREATEEEYRDALEREAAKNVAELDAVPEESTRNVVIFSDPKDSDDFISEASQVVKESRCTHPLGNTPLNIMRSSTNGINILPKIFKLPNLKDPELSHRNLLDFDSNTGASNVEESIDNRNGNVHNFFSETTELQKGKPIKKLKDNQNNEFKYNKKKINFVKFNDNDSNEGFKLSLVPKLNQHSDIINDDPNIASSKVHHIESTTENIRQLFRDDKLPLNLRNLLKLRDVELIPKSLRNKSWSKPKLDMSKFAIPNLFKFNQEKYCDKDAKYSENKSSVNRDSVQKETGVRYDKTHANDNTIADINPIKNLKEVQDVEADVMNKSLDKMKAVSNENISDEGEGDIINGKAIDLDTILSPSQLQPSFMKTDDEMHLETVISPKNVANCNTDKVHEMNSEYRNQHTNLALEDIHEYDEIASDFLNDQNTNTDSNTDSSNTILITTVPIERYQNNINSLVKTQENTDFKTEFSDKLEEGSEVTPEIVSDILEENTKPCVKENSQLSESLTILRENVVKQLKNIQKPPKKSNLFKKFNDKENLNTDNDDKLNIQTQRTMNIDVETSENLTKISMSDLQNMSDQLLDSNMSNNQNNMSLIKSIESIQTQSSPDENNFKSIEVNDNTDNEPSETNLNYITVQNDNNHAAEQGINVNDKHIEENEFLTNFKTKVANISEEKASELGTQEMDIGASNTVISTLPNVLDSINPGLKLRSPLLNDMVLPPPSTELKLLEKPFKDVLGLNTNLPTLDDLRERLVNIFDADYGSVENDSSSLETGSTNNTPLETMAAQASTRNSKKKLPLLKQLEWCNNDVIQNKPKITSPSNTLTKSLWHDLNSYRAHLQSPHSLNLKALKNEPKLGDEIDTLFKFGSHNTVPLKTSSTLANPLDNFPTLEEIQDTLRSSTRSLFNNPVDAVFHTSLNNAIPQNIEHAAKNIRVNTEKTFRGIQRKMKSSLKKPTLHNALGDSLARPQDLFDDFNDKLKGIHYDLNDRLSSIRENILDSSRITGLIEQTPKSSNRNVMTNLRKSKTKPLTPRLQTSPSTIRNKEIDLHSLGLEPRNHIRPDWNRSHKTQNVAESAAIARVERPETESLLLSNLKKISPPFRQSRTMLESLREKTSTSCLNRETTNPKDTKDLFRKTLSPLNSLRQSNKVTISIGTTTARPFLPSRPVVRVPNISTIQLEEQNPSSASSGFIDTISKDAPSFTSAISSAKYAPLRTSAPLPSSIDEDFEDTSIIFSNERFPSTNTKFKSPILRRKFMPNTQQINSNSNRVEPNIFENNLENHRSKSTETSHWPKIAENVFLTKIKDSANIRNLSNVPKSVKNLRTEQLDMLRAPTENTGVVINEPLKENVSYKCRMVCTKEIK